MTKSARALSLRASDFELNSSFELRHSSFPPHHRPHDPTELHRLPDRRPGLRGPVVHGLHGFRDAASRSAGGGGARLTNWYSNSPVCSPSRASLLTGRYPGNAGVRSILAELDRLGLAENTCTFFMGDNGPSRESRNWLDGTPDPTTAARRGSSRATSSASTMAASACRGFSTSPAGYPPGRCSTRRARRWTSSPSASSAFSAVECCFFFYAPAAFAIAVSSVSQARAVSASVITSGGWRRTTLPNEPPTPTSTPASRASLRTTFA